MSRSCIIFANRAQKCDNRMTPSLLLPMHVRVRAHTLTKYQCSDYYGLVLHLPQIALNQLSVVAFYCGFLIRAARRPR